MHICFLIISISFKFIFLKAIVEPEQEEIMLYLYKICFSLFSESNAGKYLLCFTMKCFIFLRKNTLYRGKIVDTEEASLSLSPASDIFCQILILILHFENKSFSSIIILLSLGP